MIVSASFIFWQQYFDHEEGAKYCRYYLANQPQMPHIGLVDPVTGQLIKSWTGFKDAERLLDKLTEMADTPPTDGGGDVDGELAAAIAASLGSFDSPPPA